MIQEILTEIYHLVKDRKPLPDIKNPKELKVPFAPKNLAKLYAKFSFSSVGDTLKELMRRGIMGGRESNIEDSGENHIQETYFIKLAELEALIDAEFFSNIALLIREIMRPPKGQPDSKEVILPPSDQAVLDAISALSAPIPEVVADRYFEGKTIEEISVLRGVSKYVVI